jgi:hypothetical protein
MSYRLIAPDTPSVSVTWSTTVLACGAYSRWTCVMFFTLLDTVAMRMWCIYIYIYNDRPQWHSCSCLVMSALWAITIHYSHPSRPVHYYIQIKDMQAKLCGLVLALNMPSIDTQDTCTDDTCTLIWCLAASMSCLHHTCHRHEQWGRSLHDESSEHVHCRS